jgi:hypothetical protein
VLYRNLAAAQRQVQETLLPSAGHAFLATLAQCLTRAIDETLLPSRGPQGFRDLQVRYCDHQDCYHTVAELLAELGRLARSGPPLPVDALVKGAYQLSYTLDLPLPHVEPCLDELIEALKAASTARRVARVRLIRPGDLVDETMQPASYNYGMRVLYPLGVVAYDANGAVLMRARVLCG